MRTSAEDGVIVSNQARKEWTWQHVVDRKGHEFQAVVIDFKRRKVLLQREEAKWILPGCMLHWRKYESSTEPSYLHAVVKHLTDWAWPVIFLRVVWNDEKEMRLDGVKQTMERFVALFEFSADLSMESERHQWVDLNDSNVYHQVRDAATAVEREINYAIQGSSPEKRFTWERYGWYMHAAEWMIEVLERQCGASLAEGMRYEHSSSLGAIIQANTTQGTFLLRCYATLLNDASRTKYLANAVPDHVPLPVAVDDHRQMMITRDHGEALATFCLPVDERKRVTIDYVHLQKKMVTNCDALVATGFPDFRVNVLRDELDHILANPTFLVCEERHASRTAAEQFRFFRSNLGLCKERFQILKQSPIPPTVTHNNLGFSNVYKAKGSDSYVFVDWTDGFVSHPFVSNQFGLDEDQYVREWRKYGNLEQLRELLKVGQIFSMLVRFLQRLREAAAWEEPAAWLSMKEAAKELEGFNREFQNH